MTAAPQGPLLLACALGAEQWALRRAARTGGVRLLRTGMGARRAGQSVSSALAQGAHAPRALVFTGFGAAVGPGINPGDLVVATEVRDTVGGPVELPDCAALADSLQRAGLTVHSGPLHTSERVVRGAQRHTLHRDGVLCVDMETAAALHRLPPGLPAAAVRVVVDTPDQELLRPGTLVHGLRAWRALRAAAPVLAAWTP
ncbi:1-hydroxy-2-methyl-2-butenyl 4-diphosphate reductase [Streptacidiphilus sp. PB12-B1b]|uniref:phosphorylase family protein n=1 Tax=Streptacidiphilus sp. PB12-B1b TaxID=2705012 RepID=UPI0015F8AE39|nr:1-hydroxy-2-methyl-2-butenyl 4-diphosphate reductase [Streptacidiphilus sp. PB12-B1b]QMU76467.1 1-hydroxy-2-methyl-2-butenyl 4-diphosphate reductase [Streptacidiphilus sp. PB12-B1b]